MTPTLTLFSRFTFHVSRAFAGLGNRLTQVIRPANAHVSRSAWLRLAVHVGSWIPLAWLLWDYFTGNLTINPIQAATQRTGKYALTLLVLSLACTPVNTLFKFRQVLTVRRALGLYAFMYAALHFLIFIAWDYGFNWNLIPEAIFEKPFVLVGLAALVILTSLAATSFKWWMKRLGKNWKRLHRLVYLAGGLVIVHFTWAKKGDLLRLQGDIWQPLAFGSILAVLLILRIPFVRRSFGDLRARWVHPPRPMVGKAAGGGSKFRR